MARYMDSEGIEARRGANALPSTRRSSALAGFRSFPFRMHAEAVGREVTGMVLTHI